MRSLALIAAEVRTTGVMLPFDAIVRSLLPEELSRNIDISPPM